MSDIDWAKICSEIVVALYGTHIIDEWNGWPRCWYPLGECAKGARAGDGTTLHTYWGGPVPHYYDDLDYLKELKGDLLSMRGWVVAAKYVPRHRPTRIEYDEGNMLAWVNKAPTAPNASLRKDSIKAKHTYSWCAEVLAIHKALMSEECRD